MVTLSILPLGPDKLKELSPVENTNFIFNFSTGLLLIFLYDHQLRVSSEISNGAVILNVDCDMYSNNSETIKDALCFFMDEERGHEFAFIQLPQHYNNITKNDIYGNSMLSIAEVLENE